MDAVGTCCFKDVLKFQITSAQSAMYTGLLCPKACKAILEGTESCAITLYAQQEVKHSLSELMLTSDPNACFSLLSHAEVRSLIDSVQRCAHADCSYC